MSSEKPLAKPPLRIRRATPADVDKITNVMFEAYASGVISNLIFPGGASASARATFAKKIFSSTAGPSIEAILMVAERLPQDEHEGHETEIVGFARWVLVKEPLPKEKWDIPFQPLASEELGEGSNIEVHNYRESGLHELKKKWIKGEPCLHLGILACSPHHQRIGAGSALVEWGTSFADREGMTTWLESSPAGYRLYRRFGFEDVDVYDNNITELWGPVRKQHENWGHTSAVAGELPEGCYRTVIMRRFPQIIRYAPVYGP
ncbi:Puromycin N-acetyltransferase [Cytospora mali]|uniref:Puromycin N-acetyltransferase n=1 Tax=Cytospora mali TaxID=578113 RepID=A0A194W9I9_CYTMA|nr:Puromycin N-acetyltransferase [Valsa mali]